MEYFVKFKSPVATSDNDYFWDGAEFIAHANSPEPLTDDLEYARVEKQAANEWLEKSGWIVGKGAYILEVGVTDDFNPSITVVE
jgi:hypothetical protein